VATFGALRFPKTNIWETMRRSAVLSELLDDLIEDSPFLRQIHDEAEVKGGLAEARMMLREMAQERFPDLTEADLAPIATITSRDRLHALARALLHLPDADAFRQALQAPPA
jgi:hypothetical protein